MRASAMLCFGLLGAAAAGAQSLGGDYGFAWLLSAPSAQASGLGGWQLRTDGRDPALAAWNPAALNAQTSSVLHASHDFLPTGAGRSIAAGGYRLDRFGGLDLAATVQFVGFGELEGRDVGNNATGAFKAREYAVSVAAAKHFDDRLHLGVQLSLIGGSIDTYGSTGAAVSAGAMYTPDSARRTVIGFQVQHAGYVWDDYADESDVAQPTPLTASVGISRRLRYLPMRVGILYRRLDRWDLLYDDPARRDEGSLLSGEVSERGAASETLDNLARHFALNAEFYIGRGEVLQVRAGYDHQRQREGRVGNFRSLAGFSYGVGVNLRRVRLDFGRTVQHLAGGSTHVGLLVDFAPGSPAGA